MDFKQPYKQKSFIDFLNGFLPDFDFYSEKVENDRNFSYIESITKLGKSKEFDLDVYEISHKGENDPRVSLSRETFSFMKEYASHRALVIFKNDKTLNYRLSLITFQSSWEEGKKIKTEFSNPRRYSFYLGPEAKTKTPENFLIKKGKTKNLNDLLDRFNVEIVTKEFYQNYKKLFDKLLNYLESDKAFNAFACKHGLKLEVFAKKLLGQIVFIYFLQKKGWLGAKRGEYISSGDHQFLRNIFNKCQKENKSFFNDYLEHLFYACLNSVPKMAGSFYREKFECQIPFLNGGLFEPTNDYKWQNEFINIPNEIFSNKEDSGILDIFDLYNFTINENTPDDQEISVDPEMLGKVFENLLESNVRKGQGAFYTPREIVHYMCRESLINYLTSNHSNLSEKNIRDYVEYGEALGRDINELREIWRGESFTPGQFKELDDLLKNAKIVDPACGSGAFLVGMLQEIIRLRVFLQLTPDSILFLNSPNSIKELSVYELKKETIQNSLYGVDIDPGAVDIAKLRFWLSIVVEEDINEIEPLPNLDYKIMQGNSLLEDLVIGDSMIEFDFNGSKKLDKRTKEHKELLSPRGTQRKFILDHSDDLADKLEKLHTEFFNVSDPDKKKILKKKIDSIEDDLIQSKCQEEIKNAESIIQNNPTDSKKILKNTEKILTVKEVLDKWKVDHLRPFFPWKLHFSEVFNREDKGFDVVIANPPYVDSESMVKKQPELREMYKKIYHTAKGNWDLYIPFLEMGQILLNDNANASFITPNKWYAIGYGKEIRKMIIPSIRLIANCNSIKVFDAGNSPVITVFKKRGGDANIKIDRFKTDYTVESILINRKNIQDNLSFSLSSELPLLSKIITHVKTIDNYYAIENPCSVSEAYELKSIILDLSDKKLAEQDYFKFINTGTIDSYVSLWGIKNTTYLKSKYQKPIVSKNTFKENFPRRYHQFNKPKIIISGMRHFESFWDNNGEYIAGKSTEILIQKSELDLRVALGLLNSKLIRFYIKESYSVLGIDGGINFTPDLIKSLPMPDLDNKRNKKFISLVDKILAITKSNDYLENLEKQSEVKEYEKQINELVYKLYDLTLEEIEIIEGGERI